MPEPFVVTHANSPRPLNVVGEKVTVLASGDQTGGYEVFLQDGPPRKRSTASQPSLGRDLLCHEGRRPVLDRWRTAAGDTWNPGSPSCGHRPLVPLRRRRCTYALGHIPQGRLASVRRTRPGSSARTSRCIENHSGHQRKRRDAGANACIVTGAMAALGRKLTLLQRGNEA